MSAKKTSLPFKLGAIKAGLLLLVAVALLCGCVASKVPPRQGLVMRDVSFPLRDKRFPSGLRVIVEKDDRTPLVGLFLVVGAGSTSDPAGKEGLAHYVGSPTRLVEASADMA